MPSEHSVWKSRISKSLIDASYMISKFIDIA